MADINTTTQRVLDLDKQATQGPWTALTRKVADERFPGAVLNDAGYVVEAEDCFPALVGEDRDGEDTAGPDAHLIAEYRTAAPELARALLESQRRVAAFEAAAQHARTVGDLHPTIENVLAGGDTALSIYVAVEVTSDRVIDREKIATLERALIESQAALAATLEEQSRAWALLTGERWTQTRAEGSLVEAAERAVAALAAANARAETADRQIAVHEASAKEQLRLSFAVGAAMREVTQTEIGSGNHAAARARWEEAKKKFAAFQLAPLAGPLERIEAERDALQLELQAANARADAATAFSDAQVKRLQERGTDLAVAISERDALRADLARVTAERDEARDRLSEVVPVLDRVIEERDAAKAAEAAAIRTMDQALDEYAKLPRVEADLATARESVRELVDVLRAIRSGPSPLHRDCKCLPSSGCAKAVAEAAIDALLAKHAAPAPTPADTKEAPAAVPGLVFGPFDVNTERHAVSTDGALYTVRPPDNAITNDRWFWCLQDRSFDTSTQGNAWTESEAIAAANAHDLARRSGRS